MEDEDEQASVGTHATKRLRTMPAAETGMSVLEGRAVVKLFCRELKPNFSMPWTTKRQHSSTSTAFVLDLAARLLLTNAHCVAHSSCVEVRKRGDDRKYEAEVLARGVDCDLALLTVNSEDFWAEGLDEQRLEAGIPALFTEVVCVGYPTGGDNLCVTKGVVSRVDYEDRGDPWLSRLVIQIDAAVNPGNSGGPALAFGNSPNMGCIGVAYQSLKDGVTENIGYIIPVAVVQKFLAAWRAGGGAGSHTAASAPARVTAFGHGRFTAQQLESPAMRRALGLAEGQSGVRVKRVDASLPPGTSLRAGDIILSLDGVVVGNDGCVPFNAGHTRHDRVPFPFLASQKFVGDKLEALVRRGAGDGKAGEELVCTIELCASEPLVPSDKEDPRLLSYTVVGGLVFIVLSVPYLRETFGEKWRSQVCSGLTELALTGCREEAGEEVVVLSYVLAHTVNLGFQDIRNRRLELMRVNGKEVRIRTLKQLVELVEGSKDEFLEFKLFPRGSSLQPEVLVLDRAAAMAAQDNILKQNRIPAATRLPV